MSFARKKACLFLEDGSYFEGYSFGAEGEAAAEVVFNTSLSGYQEVLTDPSYKGQMVVMTYPLIGNYGIVYEDDESSGIWMDAFIVKEASRVYSNWRADTSLQDYLKEKSVIGVEGIDTRRLTKLLRVKGAMRGIVSTTDFDKKSLADKLNEYSGIEGKDLVAEVTAKSAYKWVKGCDGKEVDGLALKVALIDCGLKYNILRELVDIGAEVTVFPATASADEIMKIRPDGIMLSNGPGDPSAVAYVADTVKKLIGEVPIFGICFGHQMLGLALGAKTFKLKFGHHGGNHPVKDLRSGRVAISVQNHGFCVDPDTFPTDDVEITHINLNDKTLEGIEHKKYPLFSVQFHPEAAPGPNDAKYLFGKFKDMILKHKG